MSTELQTTRFNRSVLIVLLSLLLFSFRAIAPGDVDQADRTAARIPLTSGDAGLYGDWNDYFVSKENPCEFLMVQVNFPQNLNEPASGKAPNAESAAAEWNDQLLKARAESKRVIADLFLFDNNEGANRLEIAEKRIDWLMSKVDYSQLYAVTLSEENIYWDGYADALTKLYKYIKEKYNVPVYQWYSCYAHAPGFDWPWVPADGWVIDEYGERPPQYEEFVRKLKINRLPLIPVVWACSERYFGWGPRWEKARDEEIAIHAKYGLPTTFFCWSGKRGIWGWDSNAPQVDQQIFQRLVDWAKESAADRNSVDLASWDNPLSPQVVPLVCQGNGQVLWREDFSHRGGQLTKAAITGFRHLRYAGGPLEFAPADAGHATHSSLTFLLKSPGQLDRLELRVHTKNIAGANATVAISTSADGHTWSAPVAPEVDGTCSISLNGGDSDLGVSPVELKIELNGISAVPGQALISIDQIQARGELTSNGPETIQLKPDSEGKVMFEDDFSTLQLLHTASISNAAGIIISDGIGVAGKSQSANQVELIQDFDSDVDLDLESVDVLVEALRSDEVGVDILSPETMRSLVSSKVDTKFDGWFGVNADPRPESDLTKRLRHFRVKITLVNRSGVDSTLPTLRGLRVIGRRSEQ